MKTTKLLLHWKGRYAELLRKQWLLLRLCRTEGQAEQVHALRTTLRRLRLMGRLATPFVDKAILGGYRKWSREISNATDRLRDYDVTSEWLRRHPGSRDLSSRLLHRRARLWKMQKQRLIPPTGKLRANLTISHVGRAKKTLFCRRFEKLAKRNWQKVTQEVPRFFNLEREAKHAFRRRLRRLRYMRELTLSKKKQERDRLLNLVTGLQDSIGEYQNRMIATEILSSIDPAVQSPQLRHFARREQSALIQRIRRGLAALRKCKAS
jgi:CHAD domain-containing protein